MSKRHKLRDLDHTLLRQGIKKKTSVLNRQDLLRRSIVKLSPTLSESYNPEEPIGKRQIQTL